MPRDVLLSVMPLFKSLKGKEADPDLRAGLEQGQQLEMVSTISRGLMLSSPTLIFFPEIQWEPHKPVLVFSLCPHRAAAFPQGT